MRRRTYAKRRLVRRAVTRRPSRGRGRSRTRRGSTSRRSRSPGAIGYRL